MAFTTPIFFNEELQPIIDEGKAILESQLGKVLAPADVEMLLLNGFSYLRQMDYIKGNEAARQNLLAYARGVMLDYLGELLAVYRLPASSAGCTILFTCVADHPDFVIPAGVRVQSLDQKATYVTIQNITVLEGTTSVSADVVCTDTGTVGNGYAPGQITIILDPQAFVSAASNTDIPVGGADTESDEALRARIQEAPNKFSVAGPDDAYIYFAKSANPAIVDVTVGSAVPGEVDIFVLLDGGELPGTEVLDQVFAACNAEKVRPLTDTVIVAAPTKVDYVITAALTLLDDAVDSTVLQQVNDALTNFKLEGRNKLGRDVIINKIKALCMVDGVYDVAVSAPASDIVATVDQYTNCTAIDVTVAGYNEG